MTRFMWRITLAIFLFVFGGAANAQGYDANMSQAGRLLTEAEVGISELQSNDVTTYNYISEKITKSGELLQASTTQSHPEFRVLVTRWNVARDAMITIAESWNAQAAQQQSAQQITQQQRAVQQQGSKQQPPTSETAPVSQQSKQSAAGLPPNVDVVMAKYRRENRPVIPDAPTIEQARNWVTAIQRLKTTQLQSDLQTLDAMLSAGVASPADVDRAKRWIADMYQQEIDRSISEQANLAIGRVDGAVMLTDIVLDVDVNNKVRAYNFTKQPEGENDLRAGQNAVAILELFNQAFGLGIAPDHPQSAARIAAGLEHIEKLKVAGKEGAEILAAAPKAKPKARPNILPSIEQKFWFRGGVVGEVDKKGRIWIQSRKVGDITNTGEIWVGGLNKGSIEPDGRVWNMGKHVGTLTDDGEVWRGGKRVGTIDNKGEVWVASGGSGSIVEFQGEWKRGAIVYFFDFFR